MPRKSQVRYYPSRKGYYTQYQGKQYRLAEGPDDAPSGPTYLAALAHFSDLMRLQTAGVLGDDNTVHVVLEHYLAFIAEKRKPNTLKLRVQAFLPFVKQCGHLRVIELKHHHVYAFCDAMKRPRRATGPVPGERYYSWGPASTRLLIQGLAAAFAWACRSGLVTINPLLGIEKPPAKLRSQRAVLSAAEQQLILSSCKSPRLRDLLVCLAGTGARPSELANAHVEDFNAALGALVFVSDDRRLRGFAHKTSGGGKDRVIYFTGDALAVITRLVQTRKRGPLFLTRKGNPFTVRLIVNSLTLVRKRLKLTHFTAYSYRHTFATEWLLRGGSIDVLAELLGNSPAVLRKHYSHLCSDRPRVRAELERVLRASPAAGESETLAPSTMRYDAPGGALVAQGAPAPETPQTRS